MKVGKHGLAFELVPSSDKSVTTFDRWLTKL